MHIKISESKRQMGIAAGTASAEIIRRAIAERGEANIILATGASQFEVLETLTAAPDIDWFRVTMFHLDEYIGLPAFHPAGFCRYLQERFVDKVAPLRHFEFINGMANDPVEECARLNGLAEGLFFDLAQIGIGENGHIAFNDPPADFETTDPFIVVELDEACRKQQLGEGWFPDLESVPQKAITMSVRQILKAGKIICSAPESRKAKAVREAVKGKVSNLCPASILQEHPDCHLFLDESSAALL